MRSAITYLIIPLLDPDGAAIGEYTGLSESFGPPQDTPEANAFGLFFKRWVRAGNRLDLVVNLHNTESARQSHLFLHRIETETGADRTRFSSAFHAAVIQAVGSAYIVDPKPLTAGPMPFKLGWHLSDQFGALDVFCELNSQSPAAHLTLAQVKEVGARIALAARDYMISEEGMEWSKAAYAVREDWLLR